MSVLICTVFMGFFPVSLQSQSQKTDPQFESLYQRWHKALESNPFLTEPMFFQTNGVPEDLATVVTEIEQNKIGLAYFLAQKIAVGTNLNGVLYFDLRLLDHVAGINLWFPDRIVDNPGQNIAELTARYRAEWQQGLYKDPSKKIAELCNQKLSKEAGDDLNPHQVVALRRYGIFGLPELIRQVKKNNSKHAFAAYLIITGQPDEYADYLKHTNKKFTTPEAKIEHVKAKVEKIKTKEGGKDFEVVKKISAALSN